MAAEVTQLPSSKTPKIGPYVEEVLAVEEKVLKRSRRITIAVALLSVAWLAVCGWYVNETLGWTFTNQLPHEVALGVAGVAMPLVILWLIALYARRVHDIRHHTEMLRQQPPERALSRCTQPDQDQVGCVVAHGRVPPGLTRSRATCTSRLRSRP